jgi:hypothetical protein
LGAPVEFIAGQSGGITFRLGGLFPGESSGVCAGEVGELVVEFVEAMAGVGDRPVEDVDAVAKLVAAAAGERPERVELLAEFLETFAVGGEAAVEPIAFGFGGGEPAADVGRLIPFDSLPRRCEGGELPVGVPADVEALGGLVGGELFGGGGLRFAAFEAAS